MIEEMVGKELCLRLNIRPLPEETYDKMVKLWDRLEKLYGRAIMYDEFEDIVKRMMKEGKERNENKKSVL